MAFQTMPLVENCNRTENPLASGWAGAYDPDLTAVWQANGSACVGAAQGSTYWSTLLPPDQAITAVMPDAAASTGNSMNLQVRGRMPDVVQNTWDSYMCRFQSPDSLVYVGEVANGGLMAIVAGPFTVPIADGDGIGCEVVGNKISAWHQPGGTGAWLLVGQALDNTLTGAGYVALLTTTPNLTIDTIGFGPARAEVHRGCEITWDANTEPDLAGYRVYTRQGGGAYTSVFYAVTPPDVTVTCAELGLTQGQYFVRITAVDTAATPNESPVSNELEITVRVPLR